jgi:phage/plasmid-associated DNA primase
MTAADEPKKDRPRGEDGHKAQRGFGDTAKDNVARGGGVIKPTDAETAFFDAPSHGTAADLFLDKYGEVTIFETESGELWELVGGVYYEIVLDPHTKLRETLESGLDRVLRSRSDEKPGELYKTYGRALQKARSRDFLRQSMLLAAERVTRQGIPWNAVVDCIPTETGILDWTGENPLVRQAKDGEFFRDPLPWDADAVVRGGDSPAWDRFQSEVFPNEDTRKTALFVSAAMVRSKPMKTFVILSNPGNGAKNTWADIHAEIIPGRVRAISGSVILRNADSSEKRFALAELEAVNAAIFDEVGGTFDVPAIKRLTSLAKIRTERKGQQPKEITPTWVPVALTNELPRFFPPDDQAFLSRLLVVPFVSVFYADEDARDELIEQGIDPEHLHPAREKTAIIDEIKQEAPAVLHQIINAAIELRDVHRGKIPESPECRSARQAYRTTNDDEARFVAEYLVRDPDGFIANDRLEELYREFSGDPRPKMKRLRTDLERRYPFIHIDRIRVFDGAMSAVKRGLSGVRERTDKDNSCDVVTFATGFQVRERKINVSVPKTENASQRHNVTLFNDDGDVPLEFQGGNS